MTLLRDIQDAAINSEIDISTVLRQCKVLAVRLGNENFKNWVDQELNGYNINDNLPDYRILSVDSKGYFSGYGGHRVNNADIPLIFIPEQFRETLSNAYCALPISAYEALLKSSQGENLQEQWPHELVVAYGNRIYENLTCISAWKVIPYSSMVSLVDSVRNRVLNFVLEIESEAPDAGDAPSNTPPLSQNKVNHFYNTIILGNVGNIAAGSTDITQSATLNVYKDDFMSLKKQLLELEVQDSEIDELKSAINKDDKNEVIKTKSLGNNVSRWLGNLLTKSA
jgi:hypothetical protein